MLLVFLCQRCLAAKALRSLRLVQARIQSHALIEDEALPIVVRSATFLEIFENAAVELKYGFEAFAFHERSGFLAADSARAEHHDGLLFHRLGKPGYRG